MKKIKQKLHSCMATLIVSSMINTPYALAAQGSSDWKTNAYNALMQAGNQYIQMRGQSNQAAIQAAAMQRTQEMLKTSQPKMGPAQYFPECPVLQRISDMPINVCESSSMNPADIGQMIAIQSMAKMSSNEYEKSTLGTLECIESRRKAFDSQLIDFQNSLKKMQEQLKQESQVFRDNTNQMTADMKSNWADLSGEGAAKNGGIDAKTADYLKQFSPTCGTFLMTSGIGANNKEGLVGLMNKSKEANLASANYSQASQQIQASIVDEGNKISAAIKSGGIDAIDLSTVSNDNQANFQAVIEAEKAAYQKKVDSIKSSIGVDIKSASDTGIENVQANYKNSMMQKCMRGEVGLNSGIKINSETINSLITQSGTDGGTAAPGYRDAVMSIINNSDMNVTMEMKLSQIQALEKTYRNMVFNSNVGGQNRSESASQAFAKLASDCETYYTQPTATGGPSPQQIAKNAQSSLQDIKNADAAIGDKIAQAITAKLINCSNNQMNSTKTCTADMMTPSKPGFCVATANKCAAQIQGCYGEISAKVGQKTAKIKTLGLQYNIAANNMIARANQLLTQQKAAVGTLLANIKQKYPGMNFVIGGRGTSGAGNAKDDPLFIANPAMSKSDFGIDLVAGGNMEDYLKELPNKIGSLQDIIADQQAKAKEQIDKYLNGDGKVKGLADYLNNEKGKWERLANQCKGMIDQSYSAIADANKKKNEDYDKVSEFCDKYSSFANSPNPGCGGADELTSDMGNIVSQINPDARKLARQAKNICAQTNNEAVAGSEATADKITLKSFCKNNTTNQQLFDSIKSKKYKIKDVGALEAAAKKQFSKTEKTAGKKATPDRQAYDDAKKAADAQKAAAKKVTNKTIILQETKTALADPKKGDAERKVLTEKQDRLEKEVEEATAEAGKSVKNDEDLGKLLAKAEESEKSTSSNTDETKEDSIRICEQIDKLKDTEIKKDILAAIINDAVKPSDDSISLQEDKVTSIMGEMQNSPCTGIASTSGKGGILPWERPPEAGMTGLGLSK